MTKPAFPHPLLVADVGGTNARFALVREPHGPPVPLLGVKTAGCPSAADAVAQGIAAAGSERPGSLILCAAGPVIGRTAKLTNAPWTFDGEELAAQFGLAQGLLLNDFEAAALSLAVIAPSDVEPIGPNPPPGHGPRVILGPGTGLGVAALVRIGGLAMALPGEAGHVAFGPADEEDERFWPRIERVCGRVTPEALLSGPGLARLHRALAPGFEAIAAPLDPPTIAERARSGSCPHCVATVAIFLKLLARFSGDMGLVYGATGGVYLRGGVMSSLAPALDQARFHAAFADKAPVEVLARSIPIYRIVDDTIALRGMAAIGAEPSRFVLDYPDRLWCW